MRTKRSEKIDLPVELVKPAGRMFKRSSKWGGAAAWVEIASIAARANDFMIAFMECNRLLVVLSELSDFGLSQFPIFKHTHNTPHTLSQ